MLKRVSILMLEMKTFQFLLPLEKFEEKIGEKIEENYLWI